MSVLAEERRITDANIARDAHVESSTHSRPHSRASQHSSADANPLDETRRVPLRSYFGLKSRPPVYVPGSGDYESKHAQDPPQEELGPRARVWRTYLDECAIFDGDMINEWRDTVDVLLVFTGLFSAILTTFVAQTSQSLQRNFSEVSTSLLYEVVVIQQQILNGSTSSTHGAAIPNPLSTPFKPAATDLWVNALWFTSLAFSLSAALFAVLVKQWLSQYLTLPSGSPRERSTIRHFRFMGFEKWHVRAIISALPIAVHLALAMFFAGLVVFLVPLSLGLACVVGAITLAVFTSYLVTNILPLVYIQCPFRTPLSDILHSTIQHLRYAIIPQFLSYLPAILGYTRTGPFYYRAQLKQVEARQVRLESEKLQMDALKWLFSMSSNRSVHRIIVQSLGGSRSHKMMPYSFDYYSVLHELFQSCVTDFQYYGSTIREGQEMQFESLLRVDMQFQHHHPFLSFFPIVDWDRVDVRLLATTLAYRGNESTFDSPDLPISPQKFLLNAMKTYRKLRLLPIIWLSILNNTRENGQPVFLDVNRDEFFCELVFTAFVANLEDSYSVSEEQTVVSLSAALHSSLSYNAMQYILDVCTEWDRFGPGSQQELSSIPCRSIIALLEYLHPKAVALVESRPLEQLPSPLDFDLEFRCLALLSCAANQLLNYGFEELQHSERTSRIICDWVDGLIATSPLFDRARIAASSSQLQHIVGDTWMSVMQIRNRIDWDRKSARYPPPDAVLNIALNLALCWDGKEMRGPSLTVSACGIWTSSLLSRVPGAYDMMIEHDVLGILGTTPLNDLLSQTTPFFLPITTFIHGISSGSVSLVRPIDDYIDYLYQPNNLFVVCLSLGLHLRRSKRLTEGGEWPFGQLGNHLDRPAATKEMEKDMRWLVQLRPESQVWPECIARLTQAMNGDLIPPPQATGPLELYYDLECLRHAVSSLKRELSRHRIHPTLGCWPHIAGHEENV